MRILLSEALAICHLVENDLRRQWGWPIHIEHHQTNKDVPVQAAIENGRVLTQDSLTDETASGGSRHSIAQDSSAPKQLPALKKFDVTCPQCMTNLAVSLNEAVLTQKILCPSCAIVFLYKEGRRVAWTLALTALDVES